MNLERTVPPHRTDPIMGLSMQIGNWTSPMKGRLSVSTFKGVGDGPSVRDEYKVCVTPVHFNDPSCVVQLNFTENASLDVFQVLYMYYIRTQWYVTEK